MISPRRSQWVLPPKRRSFRRFVLRLVLVMWVLPALLFLGDRQYMHWKRGREIANRRACGEAIIVEDFARPEIADEINAATPIRAAGAAAQLNGEEENRIDEIMFCRSFAPTPAEIAGINSIMQAHASVFQAVADARRRAQITWNVHWGPHNRGTDLKYVNDIRAVAALLSYDAWLAHHEGNDGRAMRDVSDLLYLSRLAGVEEAPFVSQASAIGMQLSAAGRLREMALTLRVLPKDRRESEAPREGAVSRQQVIEVIGEMLDDKSHRAALELAWQARRMDALEFAIDPTDRPAIFNSYFDRAALGLLNAYDKARPALACENYQQAAAVESIANESGRVGLFLDFNPYFGGIWCRVGFRVLAERRVAATALALRLYALDHGGELPQSLGALVPAYLPMIPADPFAADGRPLAYRASPVPVLYSVNSNGMDDGMNNTPIKGSGIDEWDALDAVFFLAADPNAKPRVYVSPPWRMGRGRAVPTK